MSVYPSWHESPYRWVMSAFEERDGARRLWVDGPLRVDGEALREAAVSDAASPSRPPLVTVRTQTAGRTVGRTTRVEHPAHVRDVRVVEHGLHQPAAKTVAAMLRLDVDV